MESMFIEHIFPFLNFLCSRDGAVTLPFSKLMSRELTVLLSQNHVFETY